MATYDPNWRQKALDAGDDQNSDKYAEMRKFEQSPSSSNSPSGVTGNNYSSPQYSEDALNRAIENAIKKQREAVQPAVDSLEGSAPEITAKYDQTRTDLQSQREPLKERYANLIESIRGTGETTINRQTTITNNELGKRGILGSSTLAQQEIQDKVSPLELQYKTLETTANQDQTDALSAIDRNIAGLATAETADQRALKNAIAQLISGASSQGIATGTGNYTTSLQAAQEQARLAAQQEAQRQAQLIAEQERVSREAQIAAQNALAQQELALKKRQVDYDLKKPYYKPETTTTSSSLAPLLSVLGIGAQPTANQSRYSLPSGMMSVPQISSKPALSSFMSR